jgi:hypothetical protein
MASIRKWPRKLTDCQALMDSLKSSSCAAGKNHVSGSAHQCVALHV